MPEDKKLDPEELRKFFGVKKDENSEELSKDKDSEELSEFLVNKKEKDEEERDNELISKVFTGGLQGLVTSVMNSVAGLFKDLAPIDKKLLKIFYNFCEQRKLIPTRVIENLLEYFMEQYGNTIKFSDDKIYDEDGTLWLPEDVKEEDEEESKDKKPFRLRGLTKDEVKKDEDKDFVWSPNS